MYLKKYWWVVKWVDEFIGLSIDIELKVSEDSVDLLWFYEIIIFSYIETDGSPTPHVQSLGKCYALIFLIRHFIDHEC